MVLAVLLVLPSTLAIAGPEKAREYFKEAKQAYTNGEFEKAAELLKKAYAEEANLTYQYNRIRALEGAGKYGKALEVLKTYEQPMLDAKGFEDVPQLKKSLQDKVGDTGAKKTDETTDEKEREPEEKKKDDEKLADKEPEEPTDPNRSSGSSGMKALGWGLAGVGVASLVTSALYGSLVFLPSEIRKKHRNDEPLSNEELDKVKTQQTLTVVFLAVGAGTLIGGGIVLLGANAKGSERPTSASASPKPVRVAPYVTGDGGGAILNLRF